MNNSWVYLIRVVFIVLGIIIIVFNAELYINFKQQRNELTTMGDQQKMEAQVNGNKFKYQQDEIERLSKDVEDAQAQIKDQNDVLAYQKTSLGDQKDAMDQENKDIQTSLVDIHAQADAIKQEMKSWQKDYVAVLAQLEKKTDDSQEEMKAFEDNLTALNIPDLKKNIDSLKSDIERMAQPLPPVSTVPLNNEVSNNEVSNNEASNGEVKEKNENQL